MTLRIKLGIAFSLHGLLLLCKIWDNFIISMPLLCLKSLCCSINLVSSFILCSPSLKQAKSLILILVECSWVPFVLRVDCLLVQLQ